MWIFQLVVLTFAPGFLMAGIYYLLAKIIMIHSEAVSVMKPIYYSYIFIGADLLCIMIQGAGGGLARGNANLGKIFLILGLTLQTAFMLIYGILVMDVIRRIHKLSHAHPSSDPFNPKYRHIREGPKLKLLMAAIMICVVFVFIRCVYRVVELSSGFQGYLYNHEVYFLVLDALMIFLGCTSLTVIHPGYVFGREPIVVKKWNSKGIEEPDTENFEMHTALIVDHNKN